MDGARTRGHPTALAAVGAMLRGRAPHAVLLVGPAGVGKTTLATDLAAGLLCAADDPTARPCGACRPCRLVRSGSHPDVHRLAPDGAGRQIGIGGPGSKVRGIRDLIGDLALLPVEGGARVAIIEHAQRLNEDAQAALLKTLEEPPSGVTIVLCADAEEPLLPTIRSRSARLRLGPVGVREVEAILGELDVAQPPLAGRLARIAAGRPGLAIAWAADPDALRAREELSRTLLDLVGARAAERLAGVRAAAGQALRLAAFAGLDAGAPPSPPGLAPTGGRKRAAASPPAAPGPEAASEDATGTEPGDDEEGGAVTRTPAVERRRAAEALLELWSDVTRDLALCQRGLARDVRELSLLDETTAIAATLAPADVADFLDRLGRAAVMLRGNVSPELVLDDLALRWPRPVRAAA